MQDIFADVFANIAVTGPLVRIDLAAMRAPTAQGQEPQAEINSRLIMPLDGFLRAFGMAEQIVQKLVADGIIQKREPQAAATAAKPALEAETDITPKSPNFMN